MLLSLIETLKVGCEKLLGNYICMFDSEGACHMIRDLNVTQETEQISPISIGLLNGTYIIPIKEGSVMLGKRIELNKVLYVVSLTCSLISIGKLCKELNCSVTFF